MYHQQYAHHQPSHRATTPPLYLGNAPQVPHHLPPSNADHSLSSMPSHFAAGGYPTTIPMRQAPPYIANPFNSRPSSPSKQNSGQPYPAAPAYVHGPSVPPAHQDAQQQQQHHLRGSSVAQAPLPARAHTPSMPPAAYPSSYNSNVVAGPQTMFANSSYGSANENITANAMAHYQQRLDQERQHIQQLDQEEVAIAAEEAALRLQLSEIDASRRVAQESHCALHAGWEQLMTEEQWFYRTPDLDLSNDVAGVNYRCQALQHHLDELRLVLEGHQTELRRFDGNDAVRERQRASMRMLEDCLERMECRRQQLRRNSEAHFDAEGQRERACRRYISELSLKVQNLEHKLGAESGVGTSTSRQQQPATSFSSRPTSRLHSLSNVGGEAPQTALYPMPTNISHTADAQDAARQAALRQRVVSFRSLSNPELDRSLPRDNKARQVHQQDIDAASFTVALDDESQMGDELGGINGGSFAMNLCETKRRRMDVALTAM